MGKAKGNHTTWSHHETMIVNLRDWVNREVATLRTDIAKHIPHMEDDPSILKLLKSAEDMNVQVFDLIRSVVDRAETEAKKLKAAQPVKETDEEFEE